jgi:ABC-type bacteriocin/lantibiotic exporter with double-glycine peptidase domain
MNDIFTECIDLCISECKKEKVKKTLKQEILTPLVDCILIQIQPYIIGTALFLILILVLIVLVLYFILLPSGTKS